MTVSLAPEADEDLRELEVFYGSRGDVLSARRFVDALIEAVLDLDNFPERHPLREDIAPGVRLFAFKRRVSVLYRVSAGDVWVVGVFGAGRRLEL